jgi:hypothetical protein
MLDSFDNSKRKCNQCKNYFNAKHSVNSNKHFICIDCGIKNIVKMFLDFKEKNPNFEMPRIENILTKQNFSIEVEYEFKIIR